jgi:hypothetical protein
MGGDGSGRPRHRSNGVTTACPCLEVSVLWRAGVLNADATSVCSWGQEANESASLGLHESSGGVLLQYQARVDEEWLSMEEVVPFILRPCRFGGERPFLVCPGIADGVRCRKSVCKLYLLGGYFRCRHCHRLSFKSQSYSELDRAKLKATKIANRLDSTWRRWDGFPERPKGIWRRTYRRLESQSSVAQNRVEEAWRVKALVFFRRRGF